MAYGVEPAENIAKRARARNIKVFKGYAEALPIESLSFDLALMVTTVCFLSSISKAFAEVHRILKPRGIFVIGLLERNSQLGRIIENQKAADPFYQNAHLHTTAEITDALTKAGFDAFTYWQTLFDLSGEQLEAPREGHSEGSFIVIKTQKA